MNLITGATGLVGAHVALQLLLQNKVVCAIKRSSSDITKTKHLFSYYTNDSATLFNKIKWIDADISDIYSLLDAMDGIDIVYHCAGFVSFNQNDKQHMHKINVEGTSNIVNACIEKNIKGLCYVSSIATLNNPDKTININESVYWKNSPLASNYAITKYNAEREVWRGIEEGLNAVIVNPGIIIGPGFWRQSSGKLIQNCYKGNFFYTEGTTGVINAADVANCMVQLIEQKHFNKRFILIENNYTFKEILSQISKALGKKQPTINAGILLLTVGKWFNIVISKITGKQQIITKETVIAALQKNTFNNQLIKSTLNFKFTSLSDTIKFVTQSYLNDIKKLIIYE